MNRLLKIGIVLALIGAAALSAGIEYLNRVVLPVKLRGWTEKTCSQALGRSVTIGRLRLGLLSGVVLEEVAVAEDPRFGDGPFFRADRITGKVLYLPLLKQQRLIVPALRIVRPRLQILQDADGLWNVQSIPWSPSKEGSGEPRWQLLVPKVVVEKGRLQTAFRTAGKRVTLNLTQVDAHLALTLPAKARWMLRASMGEGSPPPLLRMEGSYLPSQEQLALQGQMDLPLETLLRMLPDGWDLPVTVLGGSSTLEASVTGPLKGPYAFSGLLKTAGLRWKIRPIPRQEWSAQGPEGEGDLQMTAGGRIPGWGVSPPVEEPEALVEFKGMNLNAVPLLGELRNLTGWVRIRPDGIQTEQMAALLPSGERLNLNGSLKHDGKETFALRAGAAFSLDQLPPAVPLEIQTAAQLLKLGGRVELEAAGEGRLKPAFSFEPTLTATLREGSADLPEIGNLRDAAGLIRWRPDLLTVTDLKGKFRDLPFEIQGSLVNFARPEVDAKIGWGPLAAEARCTIDGNRTEIQALSGLYGEIPFRILGEIDGREEPVGNLYGEATLALEKLAPLIPWLPKKLNPLPLEGTVETRWTQKGPLLNPKEWEFRIKGNSPSLTALLNGPVRRRIPLEKVSFDVGQAERIVTLHSASMKLAGGTASGSGTWRTQEPQSPWAAKIAAEEMDLDSLSKMLDWKTQNLSGRFSLKVEAGGPLKDLSSIRGASAAEVRGGQILELPFLGRFADLLQVPFLKTIVFQEAAGPFTLDNGTVRTNSFQLKAPQATLILIGSGGYLKGPDSPIDWRILPTLSGELLPEESRSKIGKVIAKGTRYLAGEIRVTGTWKEPKSAFLSKPIPRILNESISDLQDALEDLF